ncbi:MAG: DUF1622 domain-containing protein [Methanocalculus sp.]|uniref:DUF1622 domain-containing protein n=2 Tax=Methanocalculus sp. TaxID=2004547 RepID=UPI002720E240|nr:DUF1622 domain-containing protein [Methanocalculus sp.]MDO9539028.1 DUF1622 domain-containing protein [Methanocalculus sp.]
MEAIDIILHYFVLAFETAGALLIIFGGVRAIIGVLRLEVIHQKSVTYNSIRRDFTNKLIFGLEFIIAADLLSTVLAPSIEDVLFLGAIVAIRTVLSYFLSKETLEYSLD